MITRLMRQHESSSTMAMGMKANYRVDSPAADGLTDISSWYLWNAHDTPPE